MRLRTLFEAPPEPFSTGPILVPEGTTASQFTRRAIFAAKRYTVPAALLSVLHQVGEAMVPVVMGLAIDRALGTGDTTQLLLTNVGLADD